jgi:hypothetical protein
MECDTTGPKVSNYAFGLATLTLCRASFRDTFPSQTGLAWWFIAGRRIRIRTGMVWALLHEWSFSTLPQFG